MPKNPFFHSTVESDWLYIEIQLIHIKQVTKVWLIFFSKNILIQIVPLTTRGSHCFLLFLRVCVFHLNERTKHFLQSKERNLNTIFLYQIKRISVGNWLKMVSMSMWEAKTGKRRSILPPSMVITCKTNEITSLYLLLMKCLSYSRFIWDSWITNSTWCEYRCCEWCRRDAHFCSYSKRWFHRFIRIVQKFIFDSKFLQAKKISRNCSLKMVPIFIFEMQKKTHRST